MGLGNYYKGDLATMYKWSDAAGRAWAAANNIQYDAEALPLATLALKQSPSTTPEQKLFLQDVIDTYKTATFPTGRYTKSVLDNWDTGATAYQVYYGVSTGQPIPTTPISMVQAQAQAPIWAKQVTDVNPATLQNYGISPVTGQATNPSGTSTLTNGTTMNTGQLAAGLSSGTITPEVLIQSVTHTPTPVDSTVTPTTTPTPTPTTTPTTTSTWNDIDTTPVNTINAQDITWRNLPPELFTFPFWREGMSGSTTTAGSTPGYTMQQPTYSPELFFPAAQQWGNWTPSERSAYQSAVQGTGASWDDVFEGLKKKWGVFTNTVQPQWAHTSGNFNWTPAGYNK